MTEINHMMTRLDLSMVFVRDTKTGFTVYFLDFPEILAEGKSKNEAAMNLFGALHDVLKAGEIKFITE